MILFARKHSSDFLQSRVKFFRKCSTEPGFLPKTVCQDNRGTERIHFIFAFPDAVILQGVVFDTVPIGGRIESICVRVDADQFGLLLNHTFQQAANAVGFFSEGNVVYYLCSRIPKPHGGDVSCDDEGVSAVQNLHCGIDCAEKAWAGQWRK